MEFLSEIFTIFISDIYRGIHQLISLVISPTFFENFTRNWSTRTHLRTIPFANASEYYYNITADTFYISRIIVL